MNVIILELYNYMENYVSPHDGNNNRRALNLQHYIENYIRPRNGNLSIPGFYFRISRKNKILNLFTLCFTYVQKLNNIWK